MSNFPVLAKTDCLKRCWTSHLIGAHLFLIFPVTMEKDPWYCQRPACLLLLLAPAPFLYSRNMTVLKVSPSLYLQPTSLLSPASFLISSTSMPNTSHLKEPASLALSLSRWRLPFFTFLHSKTFLKLSPLTFSVFLLVLAFSCTWQYLSISSF